MYMAQMTLAKFCLERHSERTIFWAMVLIQGDQMKSLPEYTLYIAIYKNV